MTAAGLDNNDSSRSQTGPALLIMETQHPSSRRTKQADITFPMLYCPLENINGSHRRQWRKRTKERMEMMLWRLAAVKLLVKTVRFTVSISTFSLRRSMGSFSTTSIPRRSVQFAPLRTPFIAAAL